MWYCLVLPRDYCGAESWLGGHFVGYGFILWRMIPFAILWSIWMERNDRISKGSSFSSAFSSAADLISSIGMRIVKWALLRKEFSNFSLNAILTNWEACMECGPF